MNFFIERPSKRLCDLAGIDIILEQIKEHIFFPVRLPEIYSRLGVSPSSGVLLHGPSGCGKTSLANAIAGELGLKYFRVRLLTIYKCNNDDGNRRLDRSSLEGHRANPKSGFAIYFGQPLRKHRPYCFLILSTLLLLREM
jgi:hypothetical protein